MSGEVTGQSLFNRIDFRQKYGSNFDNKYKKAKGILPKMVTSSLKQKLHFLADSDFMAGLSKNDYIVILDIIVAVKKGKPVKVYNCDDWEVFAENLALL